MQDFLLTLVVVFILFRIFGKSSKSSASSIHFTQNNFNNINKKKPEGEVNVDFIPENKIPPKSEKAGDYIDYEEVK